MVTYYLAVVGGEVDERLKDLGAVGPRRAIDQSYRHRLTPEKISILSNIAGRRNIVKHLTAEAYFANLFSSNSDLH